VNLSGLGGNDLIYGGAGADTLNGGAGADTLIGLGGADSMVGGDDNDVYVVDDSTDIVVETATGGNDLVYASVNITLADNVENLVLIGGATAATGTSGSDNLYGNSATGPVSLSGLGGNDLLYGGAGADTLNGGAGADTLIGLGGADSMVGGADDDLYVIDNTTDIIVELAGGGFDSAYTRVNVIMASELEQLILIDGATSAIGSSGVNNIYGHYSANSLLLDGAGGNDYLLGSAQADVLIGGLGDDGLDLRQGGDDIVAYGTAGNLGNDVIYGFDANASGGQDLIDLSTRGYTSGDIGTGVTLVDLGTHTLLQFTAGSLNGTTIFLYDVLRADVSASDFIF
jgi:Ca2+-binding RTX toxin-like protein